MLSLAPSAPVADNRGLPSAVSPLLSPLLYALLFPSIPNPSHAADAVCSRPRRPFRSSRRVLPPPPLSLLLADCVPCRRPLTFLFRAVHPVAALSVVVYFASSLTPFLRVLYRRPTAPLNLIDLEVALESSLVVLFNAPELVAVAALIVTLYLSPYLNRSSTIKALALVPSTSS